MTQHGGRVSRLGGAVVAAVVLGLFAGAGVWAGRTVLAAPEDVLAAPAYSVVTVEEGRVGRSIGLRTAASWPTIGTYPSGSAGVVTATPIDAGTVVESGSVVVAVDLRPVTVAEGEVPMFRTLALGARGDDVRQLQVFLDAQGHLHSNVDGHFGPGTKRAVQAWQRAAGMTPDGEVRDGDVVFIAELPARVMLAAEVVVGARVAPGQDLVQVLAREPRFEIPLPEGQAELVESGQLVTIDAPEGGTWTARVGQVSTTDADSRETWARLEPDSEGGSICGEECALISVTGRQLLASRIELVPDVSGVVVPSSAVVSSPTGELAVVRGNGSLVPVTVIASSDGVAVVEGIEAGEVVRAPALVPQTGGP